MADLKKSEVRAIEKAMAFPRGFGYVLGFSDRTFDEYFKDELGVVRVWDGDGVRVRAPGRVV